MVSARTPHSFQQPFFLKSAMVLSYAVASASERLPLVAPWSSVTAGPRKPVTEATVVTPLSRRAFHSATATLSYRVRPISTSSAE